MLKLFSFIMLCLISGNIYAQGKVEIKIDERINEELRKKNASVDTTKMAGFRIQIFFGSDMRESQAAMGSFRARFPEYATQVYHLYQQPTWKVRVGNFYREIDAQELLSELRVYYPDAFVVKDEIELPPLPSVEPDLPLNDERP
ncbi:MAG: SPOR domain-containing protein [Bacteroidia bacterium]